MKEVPPLVFGQRRACVESARFVEMEKLQEEHEGNQARDLDADKKLRACTCKIVNVETVLVVVIVILVLVICIAIPSAESGGLLQTVSSYFRACLHACTRV